MDLPNSQRMMITVTPLFKKCREYENFCDETLEKGVKGKTVISARCNPGLAILREQYREIEEKRRENGEQWLARTVGVIPAGAMRRCKLMKSANETVTSSDARICLRSLFTRPGNRVNHPANRICPYSGPRRKHKGSVP